MTTYTSPAGIEATPERVLEAAGKYDTFAQLPIYTDLLRPVKRIACSMSVGFVLDMTPEELQAAGNESQEFRDLVDDIITDYEKAHPDKVNQKEVLADTLVSMANELRFECTCPDDEAKAPDQDEIDAQFATIIGDFEVDDVKSEMGDE